MPVIANVATTTEHRGSLPIGSGPGVLSAPIIAAAWAVNGDGHAAVMFAISSPGSPRTWSSMEATADVADETISNPSVAIDGQGTVAMAWEETKDDHISIKESIGNSGSFATPVTISDPSAANPDYNLPVVRALDSGFMTVWWAKGMSAHKSLLQSASATTTGIVRPEKDLSDYGLFSTARPVVSTLDGAVTVLWGEFAFSGSPVSQQWTVNSTTYDPTEDTWSNGVAMTIPTVFSDPADALPADLQLELAATPDGALAAVALDTMNLDGHPLGLTGRV